MIKILLADDEIEARDNIIQYIDWAANGLELVGAAGDGEEALQMIRRLKPDIAILDIYDAQTQRHTGHRALPCRIGTAAGLHNRQRLQ